METVLSGDLPLLLTEKSKLIEIGYGTDTRENLRSPITASIAGKINLGKEDAHES